MPTSINCESRGRGSAGRSSAPSATPPPEHEPAGNAQSGRGGPRVSFGLAERGDHVVIHRRHAGHQNAETHKQADAEGGNDQEKRQEEGLIPIPVVEHPPEQTELSLGIRVRISTPPGPIPLLNLVGGSGALPHAGVPKACRKARFRCGCPAAHHGIPTGIPRPMGPRETAVTPCRNAACPRRMFKIR